MKIKVPSGRTLYEDDINLLKMMEGYGFIQMSDDPFKLNSGIFSKVYVFGREDLTDHPDFEWKFGLKSARLIQLNSPKSDKQPCLIGLPTAGTPMAQAASMVSYRNGIEVNGHLICHRVMRETLKKHGAHPKWVNGNPDPEKHTYWTFDNVVTNGATKFKADKRFRDHGYPVDKMSHLIFVDRQQGGVKRMVKKGN